MSSIQKAVANTRQYVTDRFGFSESEVSVIMDGIYARGDRWMLALLCCHAVIAILLGFFYQTWLLTFSISGMAIAMFQVSAKLMPRSFLTRCIAGVSLQVFVALHIYQMHGLPEMHFFFFTGFTMMLVYQDSLCMWPGTMLIIGQHILFAVLHNAGVPLYFFPERYVGFTKLFFHFGIAILHVAICGCWAILKRRQTLQFARQESDLREAMGKVEEATQAKSAFLAMMSHEIRTPMNAVMGMADLLLETRLSAEQRDYAESARRGADGLLAVINDILDFSKIEARKLTIVPVAINLRRLLSEIVDLLVPGAEEKGLQLVLVYPTGGREFFLGDPTRIRQITLNLLSNAIKYTEHGSVKLRVVIEGSNTNSVVHLDVVDTGVGIPSEMLSKLFHEFSQLDSRMTRKNSGTGLGLVISKRLAELMGGEIGVDSVAGEGSRFWVKLLLEHAEEADTHLGNSTVELATNLSAKVLLAEDNAVNRKVAVAFLRKFGCHVETAHDGSVAVEKWRSGNYDLIFMDCQMPELDGYSATRTIRSIENGGPQTPIIAMTAHAMTGDREACLEAGMNDYLSKPLDLRELAKVLLRWAPSEAFDSPKNSSDAVDISQSSSTLQ